MSKSQLLPPKPMLSWVKRGFSYRDHVYFKGLYVQQVRPHLEYAVAAWSPYLQQDIDVLEDVQRRAVAAITTIRGTYGEKLAAMNLPTLVDRRARGDLIETFKIVSGLDRVSPDKFFSMSAGTHSHATRSTTVIDGDNSEDTLNFVKPISRLALRRNFFSQRVVDQWNLLPHQVKTVNSLNAFKNSLDKHLANSRGVIP